MWEIFDSWLKAGADELGLKLADAEVEQMRAHARMVTEHNRITNLTHIVEPEQMALKHYIDSLVCARFLPDGASVVDVGSGAGYPGIPLLIVRKDIRLTLLDSTQKRTRFLDGAISELGLEATVIQSRAEDYGRGAGRAAFDVAVSRAVARLGVLSEYCVPLVRTGGLFIAMKGPAVHEELRAAERAIRLLGATLEANHEFELPQGMGGRSLVLLRKICQTPKRFPRRAGVPDSDPL